MSAVAALMDLFNPGDHIIAESDLYGGSIRLFREISSKNGIEFTSIKLNEEDITPHIRENTKAVYVETPTNPMMNITDIRALAEKLHGQGILLIVDNTFMSPYLQNPLALGADIVLHSGTKYLGGHNDVMAGFLVVKDEKIAERLEYLEMTTGAVLSPFDSWLLIRGIQTLGVRMDRACSNAVLIAERLTKRKEITRVIYPGLPDHPGHEIMKKQARGFGAMISFECESAELAKNILSELRLIKFAESLGGTQSLMTYPVTQTHADVPEEQRLKNGLNDRILRLSVGIESSEDLIRDIENAIDKAAAKL
jgi:cystathionine beta-lyase/cystathionine gamma-synthase